MTTAEEMRAIAAVWSAQGVQETLPLASAGYREPSPSSPSYPFLPVPNNDPVEWENIITFLSGGSNA